MILVNVYSAVSGERGSTEYPQCTVLVISVHCRPIATLPPTKTKSKDPQMLSCTKLCSNYSQKLLDRNQGRFCRKNIRLSGFDGLQPPRNGCLPACLVPVKKQIHWWPAVLDSEMLFPCWQMAQAMLRSFAHDVNVTL